MEAICRIHVLKRFGAFEWAFLLVSINVFLIYFEFISLGNSLYLLFISVLVMAFLSRFTFREELYEAYDRHKVDILLNRRYGDLMKYIFLKLLYYFLISPFLALYAMAIAFLIILIFYIFSFLINPFSGFIKMSNSFVMPMLVGVIALIFYVFLFCALILIFYILLKKLNILEKILSIASYIILFCKIIIVKIKESKILLGLNRIDIKISSLHKI